MQRVMRARLFIFVGFMAAALFIYSTGIVSKSLGQTPSGEDVVPLVARATVFTLIISLSIAISSTALGIIFGLILGLGTNMLVRLIIKETIVVFEFIGPLLPMISLVVLLPRLPILVVILVMSIFCASTVALQVAAAVSIIKSRPYILANRGFGLPKMELIRWHFWPEMQITLIAAARRMFAEALVLSGALGFWGVASFHKTLGFVLWDSAALLRNNPLYMVFTVLATLSVFATLGFWHQQSLAFRRTLQNELSKDTKE